VTVVAEAPQSAAAEACDPKMLNATIGLIDWVGAATADAEAMAGPAHSPTAAPNVVAALKTPLNIGITPKL
jgi:hypothetical protein